MYDVNVYVSMYLPQHTYVSQKTAMQGGRSFLSSRDQTQIVRLLLSHLSCPSPVGCGVLLWVPHPMKAPRVGPSNSNTGIPACAAASHNLRRFWPWGLDTLDFILVCSKSCLSCLGWMTQAYCCSRGPLAITIRPISLPSAPPLGTLFIRPKPLSQPVASPWHTS